MRPINFFTTLIVFTTILCNVYCSEDCYMSDKINEYLFHDHRFEFEDLTLALNREFNTLSIKDKDRLRSRFENDRMVLFRSFDIDTTLDTQICENEWIGTSVDVRPRGPNAFTDRLVKDVPSNHLILPLIIADISSKVNGDPNFVLHKHHLDFFLNNYFGKVEQPCIIVFKFGWSKLKYNGLKYFGLSNETLSFPGISQEVAIWITTAYKNIVGVGVDLPTIDPGSETNHVAHNTLIRAGLYVVENVDLDQLLPDAFCTAMVFPLKTSGGRSPLRFMAICPKSRMALREETSWHRN